MKQGLIVIAVLGNLVSVSTTLAQLSLNSASVNVGTIRTLFPNDSRYTDFQYAFYPEVQVDGDFLASFVGWTVYWGYWSDGLENALPVADMVSYSYSSHIVGARFSFLPAKLLDHWPLPIGIFAGTAHHFIAARYIGGFGLDGNPGHEFTADATTVELGLNAEVQVLGPIGIRGEIQQFIPLRSDYFDRLQKNRRVYKLGLAFTF
jgi:hypothetical protein